MAAKTYEFSGVPGFILGSILASIAALGVAVVVLVLCVALMGLSLFLALWGLLELYNMTAKKIRSFRSESRKW